LLLLRNKLLLRSKLLLLGNKLLLLRNKLLLLLLSEGRARNSLALVVTASTVEPGGNEPLLLLRSKLLLLRSKLLLRHKLLLLRNKLLLLRNKLLRSSALRGKLLDGSGLLLGSGDLSSGASGLNAADVDVGLGGHLLVDVGLRGNFLVHIRNTAGAVLGGEGHGGGGQRKNDLHVLE
jgi:hypothetical protein